MTWFFTSGHAVDVVLTVIAVELLGLISIAKWSPLAAILRLAPGALMLLAVRNALTGAHWTWVALPLLLSFPVHVADLARTSRRSGEGR